MGKEKKIACAYCTNYYKGSMCVVLNENVPACGMCDDFISKTDFELNKQIALIKKMQKLNYNKNANKYNGVLANVLNLKQ